LNGMQQGSRKIIILGATGSIGSQTIEVLRQSPEHYELYALTAYDNDEKLAQQCTEFKPQYAVLFNESRMKDLQARLRKNQSSTQVLPPARLSELLGESDYDTLVTGISGIAGVRFVLAAAQAGKRILFANKEALVIAGPLLMRSVAEHSAALLPIDSEHNAVFQCLGNQRRVGAEVRRITLTASGGPLLDWPLATLDRVTPQQACAHPNWAMGRKISVDSATLMNKGLEVIEAHWLFGIALARIEVLIHPQSIVHALVEMNGGSVLAQLSKPDMRIPIAYALAWPQHPPRAEPLHLDLSRCSRLEFYSVDRRRFPCLSLAYQAFAAGGGAPIVLNAANDEAVAAFLDGRLTFDKIAAVCSAMMDSSAVDVGDDLEGILAIDARARSITRAHIKSIAAAP